MNDSSRRQSSLFPLWKKEPSLVLGGDVDGFLLSMATQGASDLRIKTGAPMVVDLHGVGRQASRRSITHVEALDVLCFLFGSESAKAIVAAGRPLDFTYSRPGERGDNLRFRVNAGSVLYRGGAGLQLAIRAIASVPPSVESLRVESEVLGAMHVGGKMILVSGPTGSGKSTLLASCAMWMISNAAAPIAMSTCESPIEYILDDSDHWPSVVAQREVGRHVESFAAGAREALRQNLDVLLIGETRDEHAAQACMDAALTGHLTMTTTHATGAPETLRRIIGLFSPEQRSARATELVESLSMVVSQKLVPALAGGRVALREILPFDSRMVDDLLSRPAHEMASRARELMAARGRTFLGSARLLAEAGVVSKAVVAAEFDLAR